MLLAHLVEGRPDPGVVVVVDPAREGDARTGREKDLGLGPALGVEEIAAVDQRRREGAVVDHRPGPGSPGGAGVSRVVLSGVVAQELEGVAALGQGEPLGDEALQVDRLDLGAVLLGLAAALTCSSRSLPTRAARRLAIGALQCGSR